MASIKFNHNIFFLKFAPSFLFRHFLQMHTFISLEKLKIKFFTTRITTIIMRVNFFILSGVVCSMGIFYIFL